MQFNVLTIFPDFFDSYVQTSIIKNAIKRKILTVKTYNIRSFSRDKHQTTDDAPFGGGSGMVMKAAPIISCLRYVKKNSPKSPVLLMSPRGTTLNQDLALSLAKQKSLTLVCPRYEGVDERVLEHVSMELSIGDYVLSGGEPAALVLIDTIARLLPKVLGNTNSLKEESFQGGLLEYPQYTRPDVLPSRYASEKASDKTLAGQYSLSSGLCVPPILLSGNHAQIRKWRKLHSIIQTLNKRPDIIKDAKLSREEKKFLNKYLKKKLSLDELKFLKGEIDDG